MWQPAEGGEAISAAEAGYGTLAGSDGEGDSEAPPDANAEDEVEGVETVAPAAEEAALHIEEDAADIAADELASDADLDDEEEADIEAAAEEELEVDGAAVIEEAIVGDDS
jgi:hypothetical protein